MQHFREKRFYLSRDWPLYLGILSGSFGKLYEHQSSFGVLSFFAVIKHVELKPLIFESTKNHFFFQPPLYVSLTLARMEENVKLSATTCTIALVQQGSEV